MFKRIVFCAFAAIAALAGQCASTVEPMASQKWVKMTVSNETEVTKEWVRQYVSGGGEYEYDFDNDIWVEGNYLCMKVNGKVQRNELVSVKSERTVNGFYVTDDSESGGAVSNGMFYAWVGGDYYSCPENKAIPLIETDGVVTQVVNDATNVYQSLSVVEHVTDTNGVQRNVNWESAQISKSDWRLLSIGNGATAPRYFTVSMTEGKPLPESPLSLLYPTDGRNSLFDIVLGILCPTAYAASYDVNVSGMSGELTISFKDGYGEHHNISVGIAYDGGYEGYPEPPYKAAFDETGDPDDEGRVTITHYKWTPDPSIRKSDWTSLANWLPATISYSYYQGSGSERELITKNIPRATLSAVVGSQLTAQLEASWKKGHYEIWQEQKFVNCQGKGDYGHRYKSMDGTMGGCVCIFCGYDRKHSMEWIGSGECEKCANFTGWEKKHDSTKCGGYSTEEQYHHGWRHTPESGYTKPTKGNSPGSSGYVKTCTCQCANMKKDHSYDKDWYIVAGDISGREKKSYHTLVYQCERCESLTFGWRAITEGHMLDDSKEYDIYPYKTVNGEDVECEPTDPNVNRSYHHADGFCKLCTDGGRATRIEGKTAHTCIDNPCVCDQCGAVMHVWAEGTCPKVAYCTICNKSFPREDDTVLVNRELSPELIPSFHSYANPESQIWEGDAPNMEHHVCRCFLEVKHMHNWVGDDGNRECGQGEDGTAGCGLKEHNQDNCPCNDIIGECNDWKCRVCLKKLTQKNTGTVESPVWVALPTAHGSKSDGKFGYAKNDDGVPCCAYCNNYGTRRCGTHLKDDYGNTKFIGHVIYDPECHVPYKKDTKYGDDYHSCRCYREGNTTDVSLRRHNIGTLSVSQLKGGDPYYHKEKRTCDLKSGGEYLFDDCFETIEDSFHHNWHIYTNSDGNRVYTQDEDGGCTLRKICRTYDGNGVDKGCGLTKQDPVAHEWHRLSWFPGGTDVYTCGTGNQRNLCFIHERCEHGVKGGATLGCGKTRSDGLSTSHEYAYSNPSTYINDTYHSTDVQCAHDCGFYEEQTNNHNHTISGYTNINESTHTKFSICAKDFSFQNPGCGHVFYGKEENHDGPVISRIWNDNDTHIYHKQCSKCEADYGVVDIHLGMGYAIANDAFTSYLQTNRVVNSHSSGAPDYGPRFYYVDVIGTHIGQSTCAICSGPYHDITWRICKYDVIRASGGVHELTCSICGETVEGICYANQGIYKYLDRGRHACFASGEMNGQMIRLSPYHAEEEHDLDERRYCAKCDTIIPYDDESVTFDEDIGPDEYNGRWGDNWPINPNSVFGM